ncbi:hypothetical protein GCM10025871_37050 [Deinococcus metallilatus]|nr:hypothetical protein GCM10025871_37050 [Deinococcus metallilatus]
MRLDQGMQVFGKAFRKWHGLELLAILRAELLEPLGVGIGHAPILTLTHSRNVSRSGDPDAGIGGITDGTLLAGHFFLSPMVLRFTHDGDPQPGNQW